MALTLHLRAGTWPDKVATVSRGRNDANKVGSNVAWHALALLLDQTDDAANTTTVTSVAGPTAGIEPGSPRLEWISPPLSAAFTISGTVTFGIFAHESSMSANATVAVKVERLDRELAIVSVIVDSSFGTELTTSNAENVWTASPTSTAMLKGERIRITIYFDDATALTMASGHTLTMTYDGPVSSSADSTVQFTENLTFQQPVCFSGESLSGNSSFGGLCWGATDARYVALAANGSITYSTDGKNWTLVTTPDSTTNLEAVTYGATDDVFVAVGANAGVLKIWTSAEGVNWTNRTVTDNAAFLYDVCYGSTDDLFVAVGDAGAIHTSPSGVTWTARTGPNTTDVLRGVCYGGPDDLFVAVGDNGVIWTSANGTTGWTAQTTPDSTTDLRKVAYASGADLYVAVGFDGSTPKIWTSPQGTAWTNRTVPAGMTTLNGVCYDVDHDLIVACGDQGSVISSTNGIDWTLRRTGQGGNTNERIAYSPSLDQFMMTMNSTPYHRGITASKLTTYTTLYLLSDASDIADQGTVEKKAWTTKGVSTATAVRTSVAGWTAGVQWTDTAGGTVIEWFTVQLNAATLSGIVIGTFWDEGAAAEDDGALRLDVAVVNDDGTGATLYGSGVCNRQITDAIARDEAHVTGQDLSIAAGQRLRFRLMLDDHEAALVTGRNKTAHYSGAAYATTGDSYIIVPVALSEFVSGFVVDEFYWQPPTVWPDEPLISVWV